MPPLHASDYFIVEELPGFAVKVTRLGRPFTSASDVETACVPVQVALDRLGRSRYVLLLDARQARGANDPEREDWFASHRKRMVHGFRRVAVLMRTAVGALHSDRVTRSDGTRKEVEIFLDLAEACDHLGIVVPPSETIRP